MDRACGYARSHGYTLRTPLQPPPVRFKDKGREKQRQAVLRQRQQEQQEQKQQRGAARREQRAPAQVRGLHYPLHGRQKQEPG